MATVKHFPIISTDKSFTKDFFKCPMIHNENEKIKVHTFRNGVSCLLIDEYFEEETFLQQCEEFSKYIQTVDIDDNFDFIIQSNKQIKKAIAVFIKP